MDIFVFHQALADEYKMACISARPEEDSRPHFPAGKALSLIEQRSKNMVEDGQENAAFLVTVSDLSNLLVEVRTCLSLLAITYSKLY